MSYPRDIDSYTEAELQGELDARTTTRARGRCDYCNRHPFTRPCMHPERHRDPRIIVVGGFLCDGTFRKFADYSKPIQERYRYDDGMRREPITDHTTCNICGTRGELDKEGQLHNAVLTNPVG